MSEDKIISYETGSRVKNRRTGKKKSKNNFGLLRSKNLLNFIKDHKNLLEEHCEKKGSERFEVAMMAVSNYFSSCQWYVCRYIICLSMLQHLVFCSIRCLADIKFNLQSSEIVCLS